jgi:hypothetical protein
MGWEYISSDKLKVTSFSIEISDNANKIVCNSLADNKGPRLLGLGIKHDIFSQSITGILYLEDARHVFEKLNPNVMNCYIKIIDSCPNRTDLNVQQCTYQRVFKIAKIIGQPDRAGVKIIYLIDAGSFEMQKTFQGGSFQTKNVEDNSTANFFKNILTALGYKPDFKNFFISKNDRPRVHKLENDRSLLQNLQELSEEAGYFMFPTNDGYFLGELNKTNLSKLSKGLVFTDAYNPNDNNIDYIGMFFDCDVDQTKPMSSKTMVQLNDGTTTYVKQSDVNDLDIMINNNDEYTKSQETFGSKQGKADFVSKVRYSMQKELLQQNHMRIYVPGSFYYDEVGQIVNVKKKSLSPKYSERLKGDQILSGNWIIMSSNYFLTNEHKLICILDLIRFDNPKLTETSVASEKAEEKTAETKEKAHYTFIPKFEQLKYDCFANVFDNFETIRKASFKQCNDYKSKATISVLQKLEEIASQNELWSCDSLWAQFSKHIDLDLLKKQIVTIKEKGYNYSYGVDMFMKYGEFKRLVNGELQLRGSQWAPLIKAARAEEQKHFDELNKALSDYDRKLYNKAIKKYTNTKTIDTVLDTKSPDIAGQEEYIKENGFTCISGYSSNPDNKNLIVQHCKLLMRAYE